MEQSNTKLTKDAYYHENMTTFSKISRYHHLNLICCKPMIRFHQGNFLLKLMYSLIGGIWIIWFGHVSDDD